MKIQVEQLSANEFLWAKDWIKECLPWRDLSCPEEVEELTEQEIISGIKIHYSGGIKQFKLSVEDHIFPSNS
ncbi:MAG: hypothetical protein HWQ44_00235 [Nostoc sp. JL34]|uniref:hypothetical protein n=1 Tax=Nostoc sp. JL34 TaxID=2815397 RepID=UPI001DEFB28B|nr:hypothetical protein [Nostoc sp. JL34]MBN3881442.1 hypothetical protein [Nostoc sp. JL34]